MEPPEQLVSALVGRGEELAVLETFLDAPERPEPAALVLEGEAGIGKTTLWRAGIALARSRGYRVLEAAPGGSETELSFAALRDMLDDVFDDVADALPDPQRRALAVALLREEPEGQAPGQGAVAAAALSSVRAMASKCPVLLALDDTQWLDAESATVIEFVARRLREDPARLLLARRLDADLPAPFGLDRTRLPVTRIAVGGLSLGALHALVRESLGRTYPRPALRRLHEISGGNPFYALELARAAGASATRPEDISLPDSLDEVVAARFASLSPAAGSALASVALAASPDEELIKRAGEKAGLDEALEAGVIELTGGRIRFAHPLLAGAVLRRLDPQTQRATHRALAYLVPDEEERALHLAGAAEGPDGETVTALEAAATVAVRRGAPSRAAQLLEYAVALAADAEAGAKLKVRAGEAHFSGGDPLRARELLEQAVAELPAGPTRARALWRLAIARGELEGARVEVDLLQQVLAETSGDLSLHARVLRRLGRVASYTGDVDLAARSARRALELAEQLGDPGLLADALSTVAKVELLTGRSDQALFHRAIELERKADHELPLDDSPTADYSYLLLQQFEIAGARERFLALLERGLDQGDETNVSGAFYYLSLLELLAGNLASAERYAREALELAEQSGVNLIVSLQALAKVHAYRGDVEAAHALAGQSRRLATEFGNPFFVPASLAIEGFAELSAGQVSNAARLLEEASVEADANGLQNAWLTRFRIDRVEALVLLGHLDDARLVLDEFRRAAEASESPWAIAAADHAGGLILAAKGDTNGATASFDSALKGLSPYPVPFERARTLLALGAVQRRAKQKAAARSTLEQALELFEQVGTPLWTERARDELARISGRAPATGALTPSEQQVAQLVEQGSTNKEVAATLYLSVKTVEAHLSHIYAKLGIRSRSELAHRSTGPDEPKL